MQEVRDWMDQVKRETKPPSKPLPEPKDFIPFAYAAQDAIDPFNPNKLLAELARDGGQPRTTRSSPTCARRRELLETFRSTPCRWSAR